MTNLRVCRKGHHLTLSVIEMLTPVEPSYRRSTSPTGQRGHHLRVPVARGWGRVEGRFLGEKAQAVDVVVTRGELGEKVQTVEDVADLDCRARPSARRASA